MPRKKSSNRQRAAIQRRVTSNSLSRVVNARLYVPAHKAVDYSREIFAVPSVGSYPVRKLGSAIPLARSRRTVPVTVRLKLPARRPVLQGSYSVLSGNALYHAPARVAAAVSAAEPNTRRDREYKARRRDRSNGQIHAVRSDRFGLLSANRFGTGRQINFAAALTRALGG